MQPIILDHKENIVLIPDSSTIQNCHAAQHLRSGIWSIAKAIRGSEVSMLTTSKLAGKIRFAIDNSFEVGLTGCYFHWFATSVVNYARLVSFIGFMNSNRWNLERLSDNPNQKKVKKHCDEYVKRVIPEAIVIWRNKVSAHFAATAPWKDNLGTLQDSIFNPIAYSEPYFHASLHRLSYGEYQSSLQSWALSKVFEELSPRFWPDLRIPSLPNVDNESC